LVFSTMSQRARKGSRGSGGHSKPAPKSSEIVDVDGINKEKNGKKDKKQKEEVDASVAQDLQCGICFEKPTLQGTINSCKHTFCFECIEIWSKTANTCPFCKERFTSIVKLDPANPRKRQKKVKVQHQDQRVQYDDDPGYWYVGDEDEDDDENVMEYHGYPWTHIFPFLTPLLFEEYDDDSEIDEEIDIGDFGDGWGLSSSSEDEVTVPPSNRHASEIVDLTDDSPEPRPPAVRPRSVARRSINAPREPVTAPPPLSTAQSRRASTGVRQSTQRGAARQTRRTGGL